MNQLPIIDDRGDINLHGRSAPSMVLEFWNANGGLRDVSGTTVVFECGVGINKTLTNVSGQPSQKLLSLTNLEVKTIYDAINKQFVLLEAGVATWAGSVFVYGWIE